MSVRNTILKMGGLQCWQQTDCFSFYNTSGGTQPAWQSFPLGSPFELSQSVLASATSIDSKAYIRQMSSELMLTNGTNMPVLITAYKVVCRRPVNLTVETLIDSDSPYRTSSFQDPTISAAFRRFFKIVKRKRRILMFEQSLMLKQKHFFRSGRMVTQEVEGNISLYRSTKLTSYWMVTAHSLAVEDTTKNTNILAPVKINYLQNYKYTWYIDQANTPVSTNSMNVVGPSTGDTVSVFTNAQLVQAKVDSATQDPPGVSMDFVTIK